MMIAKSDYSSESESPSWWRVIELKFSNGLWWYDWILSCGEDVNATLTITWSRSRSKLILSAAILRKFRASTPSGLCIRGNIGGSKCRRRAKLMDLKNGWDCKRRDQSESCCVYCVRGLTLTSDAPAREPSRLCSSFCRSFRIRSRQWLETGDP